MVALSYNKMPPFFLPRFCVVDMMTIYKKVDAGVGMLSCSKMRKTCMYISVLTDCMWHDMYIC